MTEGLTVRGVAALAHSGLIDIRVVAGRIAAVVPSGPVPPPGPLLDGGGRVVVPAFVEAHVHLDKAYLDPDGAPASLAGAIAAVARSKRRYTRAAVRGRALRAVAAAVAGGTTTLRAHTDVDPVVGMTGVAALLELRDELRDLVTLQVVAFPQEGIFCRPGTVDLLRQCLDLGADVVGGCPYAEASPPDARGHVEAVLDLAAEYGVPADLHADLADDTRDERFGLAGHIADQTIVRGLNGQVTIGHATSLAALPPERLRPVLDALRAADVAVVVLPATDLHLGGRADTTDVRRGIAPVRALRAAGIRTTFASNNVRNAFTPTGRFDMLDIGLLLARTCHTSTAAEFDEIVEMATVGAADVVSPGAPYGLLPGAPADLVVLDSRDPSALLLDQPARSHVLKAGRRVFGEVRTGTFHGAAAEILAREGQASAW